MDILSMIRALRARKTDPRAGAEEINKSLPDVLSARPAILKDRERKAQMAKMVDQPD